MSDRRVVYEHSVEALFSRALRSKMSEPCLRELREAGLDLSRPLKPQYPELDYEKHIRIARRHLFPGQEDPEAYRLMGRLFIRGYLETTIGAALRVLLRMLGPDRNLARMPGYFEAGTSYVHASGERHGPGDWTLHVSAVAGFPTFTQGSLEETMLISGAKDAVVEYALNPDRSVRYRIRWGPGLPAREE